MDSKEFLTSYFNDFSDLVKPDKRIIDQLEKVAHLLKVVHNDGKKTIIFGNGGSAAIASHFSVDLTKNAGLRCINCNESDLITCFANDYGFEHWVEKAVDFYGDDGDLLIVISSSGKSKNMLNGVKAARNGKFRAVVTFSGFAQDNPLSKLGDINLWVNSRAYNFVENIHQIWLLAIVDLIIGSREYSA
jgi:D-sedoheptulose 7-phosphate isomerase